jgi:hypothetical protein
MSGELLANVFPNGYADLVARPTCRECDKLLRLRLLKDGRRDGVNWDMFHLILLATEMVFIAVRFITFAEPPCFDDSGGPLILT